MLRIVANVRDLIRFNFNSIFKSESTQPMYVELRPATKPQWRFGLDGGIKVHFA